MKRRNSKLINDSDTSSNTLTTYFTPVKRKRTEEPPSDSPVLSNLRSKYTKSPQTPLSTKASTSLISEDFEEKKVVKKKTPVKKSKKNEDDDDLDFEPPTKNKKNENSDEEEDLKKPVKKKSLPKNKKNENDEEEDVKKPVKKKSSKNLIVNKKKTPTKKKTNSKSDDIEDPETSLPLKKKKSKTLIEGGDDDEDSLKIDSETKKTPKKDSHNTVSETKKTPKKKLSTQDLKERLMNITRDEARHKKFSSKLKVETEPSDDEGKEDEESKENSFYKVGAKFTPMENQFLQIRKKYPDLILFWENGYRFLFLGKDADVASKILGILSYWRGNFLTACVPVGRFFIHARRFVQAGHKIGVVSQTETPALKAASKNKNKLFDRAVTAVYSKSTFINQDVDPLIFLPRAVYKGEEGEEGPEQPQQQVPEFVMGQFLMCVYEEQKEGKKEGEVVDISLVAVQTSTGDIIYDQFEDGFMRKEFETRLYHINPIEILLPKDLSPQTEKILKYFNPNKTKEDKICLERYTPATEQASVMKDITKMFVNDDEEDADEEITRGKKKATDLIQSLSWPLIKCIMGLLNYLKRYNLQSLFFLDCNYQHFTTKQFMKLDANTLLNLEIFSNPSTGLYGKGTLFWVLNHTKTAMGHRQLIEWMKKPLMDVGKIRARLDAVEELTMAVGDEIINFFATLSALPDLERGICRVYYRKCSPIEFIAVIHGFKNIMEALPSPSVVSSPLLKSLFGSMPDLKEDLSFFFEALNPTAMDKGLEDPVHLFVDGVFPDLSKAKKNLAKAEKNLQNLLTDIRKILGDPNAKFVTVSKLEFLIEVKNINVKRVPNSWISCGGTKLLKRFQPPEVKDQLQILNQCRERLTIAAKESWNNFLELFGGKYSKFRDFVGRLATLDCLKSASTLAQQTGYVKPTITDRQKLYIENGRHPVIELLTTQCMPNSLSLGPLSDDDDAVIHKSMLLTGPNMGGKTSYTRQIALIIIMAQIGYFVPASTAILSPVDGIYTRMGAHDNEVAGQSTFFVEIQETAHMLSLATSQSLVVLDELGRGTSTHDGVAIAYATLNYLITSLKPWTLFVTHYPALAQLEQKYPGEITSHHMGYVVDPEDDKNVIFLFQLLPGIERRSYGLNVAQLANIPLEILNRAKFLSTLLEKDMTNRQNQYYFKELVKIVQGDIPKEELPQLLQEIHNNVKLVIKE